MRECLRAILILQCDRHGTGKRRRQRIEAQAAGNNIIIIGDGEKTVFFLVDVISKVFNSAGWKKEAEGSS